MMSAIHTFLVSVYLEHWEISLFGDSLLGKWHSDSVKNEERSR